MGCCDKKTNFEKFYACCERNIEEIFKRNLPLFRKKSTPAPKQEPETEGEALPGPGYEYKYGCGRVARACGRDVTTMSLRALLQPRA